MLHPADPVVNRDERLSVRAGPIDHRTTACPVATLKDGYAPKRALCYLNGAAARVHCGGTAASHSSGHMTYIITAGRHLGR